MPKPVIFSKKVCRTDCFLAAVLNLLRKSKALALTKSYLTFESQTEVLIRCRPENLKEKANFTHTKSFYAIESFMFLCYAITEMH